MEYVIVAFRSRAHTVSFSDYLRKFGLQNEIVNTPKEAGVGCGLSVKVSKTALTSVKRAAYAFNASSFAGFFVIKVYGNQRLVKSI